MSGNEIVNILYSFYFHFYVIYLVILFNFYKVLLANMTELFNTIERWS
jgi:hypothetical protein